MKIRLFVPALVTCMILAGCSKDDNPTTTSPTLKINDMQVIGSHNSFKQDVEPNLLTVLKAQTGRSFQEIQYGHQSLTEQLQKYNLRNLELDVVHDPDGGRFAAPKGFDLLRQGQLTPLPYDTGKVMTQPGFKVLHIPDIDFRSNCLRLTDCLNEIKAWSTANPKHLPICITFNATTSGVPLPNFTTLLSFSSQVFDQLEKEILSVIPRNQILTPDDVRGAFSTLEEAVLKNGWPNLEASRGKLILVLDETGQKMNDYVAGHPSLKDRLMFVTAEPGKPEAAFMIKNDPVKDQETIKNLVKSGYLVRTRADQETVEARAGNLSRFEAALSSGAHFISTDYYKPDERLNTGYEVKLPGGVTARCNPVREQPSCTGSIAEN